VDPDAAQVSMEELPAVGGVRLTSEGAVGAMFSIVTEALATSSEFAVPSPAEALHMKESPWTNGPASVATV
jgi:hypothetical protein